MENNEELMQQPGVDNPLPGKLLRETRTGRNLTLEQVADDLCLTPQQVEAMENDDYADLPGATYVRGYLRNYARLLGLPEERILETAAIPTTVIMSGAGNRKAAMAVENTRNTTVAFLTAVIVAILLGLIYSWWQSRETPGPEPVTSSDTAQSLPESVRGAAAPAAASAAGQSAATQTSAEVASPPAASAAASGDVIPESAPANLPAAAADAGTPQDNAAPAATEPVSVSSADGSNLVLKFSADSWVDIQDASGNTLIRRTVPAGETIAFRGTPPFKVFLGYARGVNVNYRAEDYDVTPHISGAIARFTLQ